MDFAKLLSPAQLEAATCTDAPVCILAGAGSGKTRVVTHRIAYLIQEKRERPWTILAVTFTNKAAGEMRHRVDRLVPGSGPDVQIGTFHGMAARLLRRHGRAVGVPPSFVIYDQDDAQRLMKRIVTQELNYSKDTVRPIMSYIDSWQSEGLSPSEVPEVHWNPFEEKARAAYAVYQERLSRMNAVDFGGLLLKLRELLKLPGGQDVRARVQHLLVDEYQDTNRVQADITLMLAETAKTVAVVGDDDQAIYGWRGASADNLKRFLDAMPGSVLVKLEDNYRSTRTILDAANGVIEHNLARLGKTLRSTREDGLPVRIVKCHNDIDEARRITDTLQQLSRAGRSLEDMAVLYRTNALSRPFEDELRRHRVPYRIIGGVRFYDRKEVKDVLATLRCALNPQSDVDTARMIAAVPRGIGEASVEKISRTAQARGISVLEAMADERLLDEAGVKARAKKSAMALASSLRELGQAADPDAQPAAVDAAAEAPKTLNARDAIALAIDKSGVSDRLEAESSIESEGRLENLEELLNAAAQFVVDQTEAGQPTHALAFLETAALLGSIESEQSEDAAKEKVTLMTLHSAKGLEYGVVFLVGMEEHGFPHTRAITEDAPASELEEERRLAYVGITRARERLWLSWAQRRMVQGSLRPRTPSRFLKELPDDVTEGDKLPRSRSPLAFSASFFRDDDERHDAARARSSDDGPHVEYDDAGARRRQLTSRILEQRRGLSRQAPEEPTFTTDDACKTPVVQAPAPGPAGGGDEASRFARGARGGARPGAPSRARFDEDQGGGSARTSAESEDGLSDGMRVTHEAFGPGTILAFRGVGRMRAALVRFDGARAPRVIIARHLTPAGEAEDDVHVVYDEVNGG